MSDLLWISVGLILAALATAARLPLWIALVGVVAIAGIVWMAL